MNKRQFTGFMFLLCTCTAFAQQVEVKKDSIDRAVLLPPEQKQPLNMDKEGFILPDMNITPNDRKPTIQTDSMTLHISPSRIYGYSLAYSQTGYFFRSLQP